MFNKLTIYVCRTLLFTTFIIVVALSGIFIIFTYIAQTKHIGEGTYSAITAIEYVMLILPYNLYILLPFCSLLGSLMGLGLLANNSEITVMRAAGYSTFQVAKGIILAGTILSIIGFVLGGYIAPYFQKKAEILVEIAKNGQKLPGLFKTDSLWIKTNDGFDNIQKLDLKTGKADGLTKFIIKNNKLEKISFANDAVYHRKGKADVYDINSITFPKNESDKLKIIKHQKHDKWNTPLTISTARIISLKTTYLNFTQLVAYIMLPNTIQVKPSVKLSFWKSIFQPISLLLLMVIAVPFSLGSTRSSSVTIKLILGGILGFFFFLLNQMFGPITILYKFPPFWAACTPTIIALVIMVYLFIKLKE